MNGSRDAVEFHTTTLWISVNEDDADAQWKTFCNDRTNPLAHVTLLPERFAAQTLCDGDAGLIARAEVMERVEELLRNLSFRAGPTELHSVQGAWCDVGVSD